MKADAFIVLALAMLLGLGAATDAQAYRWVDEKGQVHYSNIPPSRPAPPEATVPSQPSEQESVQGLQTGRGPELQTSPPAAQARPQQHAPVGAALGAPGKTQQEQTPGVGWFLGAVVAGLGFVVITGGGIWLLVVGFKRSVLEGLLMLFVSPYQLIFVFNHWQEAKRPFLVQVAGVALVLFGTFLAAWSRGRLT